MVFPRWRARRASKALIEQLRGEIVAAARRPALYEVLGAPDRIDGQFEILTLHVGLVLRRLVAIGGLGHDIAQDLVNAVFLHFDDTLREMALSDIGGLEASENGEGSVLRPERRLRGGARVGFARRTWTRRWRVTSTGAADGARMRRCSPIMSRRSTPLWPRCRSRTSRRDDSAFPDGPIASGG